MAKKLSQEDLVLNIVVNGNKARSDIGKVSRDLRDTKGQLESVAAEMKRLETANKQGTQQYQDLTAEATRLNQAIDEQKRKLADLNSSLKLEERSLGELTRAYKNIKKLRDQQVHNSEGWKQHNEELKAIRARMHEIGDGATETGGIIDRLSGSYSRFAGGMLTGTLSLTAIWSGINKAADAYAKFDDVLADVMKTTNLNKQSVKELNAELEKIDTRTSQEDLLGLGRIAGKLGYTEVEDISKFVRANNEIIVSLNEDLGGNVEETVNKIGKLVDIFKLKDLYTTEEAFLKVGSALNELGMASTANEGYMVEFARRMAGVAPLAKVTIEQIFGLGAALDQLGQTEEVSSTALSKLFLQMASDSVTYAKYAGMEFTKFQNLLENDFMGAFVKVLKGVKDSAGGINELAATLGDLGADGGRVIAVLGSLANNTDVLTSSIDLSNRAMAEGTSITNEYNIKNETAAAKIERKRKEVNKLWRELGEKLWPSYEKGMGVYQLFLSLLLKTIGFIGNNFTAISSLTIAVVAYTTANKVMAQIEAATTSLMAAKRVVLIGVNGLYALLTGNLTRAAAAQRLLNIQVAANPYGLAAVALVGLIGWMINIANRMSDAEKAQKKVNAEMAQAKELSDSLKASTQDLVNTINDSNITKYAQAKAFTELQKLYPQLLQNMSLEEFQTKGSTNSLLQLNKAREDQEKALTRSNYAKAVEDVKALKEEYTALSTAMAGNQSGGLAARFYELKEQLALAEEQVKQYGAEVEILNRIEFNAKPLAEKLAFYNDIKSNLTSQIGLLESQEQTIDGMNKGWNNFNNWVNSIRLDGLMNQLADVNKKIKSLTPADTQDADQEIKSIGQRRAFLENQIKALTQAYENLNEKDIAARTKNIDQRKKLRAELEALDGKSTTATRDSGKAERARQKAYKDELDSAEKHHQKVLQDNELFREEVSDMTEEQLIKMAQLESDYQTKVDLIHKKYGDTLKTTSSKAQTELDKRKKDGDRYVASLIAQKKSEVEAEKVAYDERLKKAGLFNMERSEMTERQIIALQVLEKEHQNNLLKIAKDSVNREVDLIQNKYKEQLADMRIAHNEELSSITTLSQAKDKLSGVLSAKELAKVKTLAQAKKLITNQQQLEEEAATRQHLEKLLRLLQEAVVTENFEGIDLSDELLPEEKVKVLNDRIRELKEELAKLKGQDATDLLGDTSKSSVDIFGMSSEDWTKIFDNLKEGKFRLEDMLSVLSSASQMYQSYASLVATKENAILQNDQTANEQKKESLKKRLDAGMITQDAYNKSIERMDKEMDRKRSELTQKQAKREKSAALMSAIVNTAAGVVKVLASPGGIAGIILAAIIGGMGALQISTIASTPLPAIEGRESGGYLDVQRSQDGKLFNAKVDPDKRGYVDDPTVIVGESGREWVASNDLVTNPFTAPVISYLDTVQKNGQINPSVLGRIVSQSVNPQSISMDGRQGGGYFSSSTATPSFSDPRLVDVLEVLNSNIVLLESRLSKEITANVALLGKDGFISKMDELNQIQNNANL